MIDKIREEKISTKYGMWSLETVVRYAEFYIQSIRKKAEEIGKIEPPEPPDNEYNELLRSFYQVIDRKGKDTNWQALHKIVGTILKRQFKALHPNEPIREELTQGGFSVTARTCFLKDEKEEGQSGVDATKEMLAEIISWEKNLSEYESLESILRKKYIIFKRTENENNSNHE